MEKYWRRYRLQVIPGKDDVQRHRERYDWSGSDREL